MRILLALNRLFLPQRAGGIESSVHDMANALHQRGENVSVLARLNPSSLLGVKVLTKRFLLGGYIRSEPYGLGYRVYRTPMMTRDLPLVLKQTRPDIAIFQVAEQFDLGLLLAQHGVPTILHIRGAETQGNRLPFVPAAVIANSHFTAKIFEQQFGAPATVIYNIIDENAYRVKSTGDRVVLINPVKKKGLDIALALARSNSDIPFLFVEGWPQSKSSLSKLKCTLDQLPNVEFLSRQHDMRTVYRRARVLLVPSQWAEAWGRVISEAQFSGIPVLASNCGGIPEALGSGGLLLPPTDLDAWHSALRQIWDDPEYWMVLSTNALRNSSRADLNVENIIDNLLDVLHRAARNDSSTK